MKTITIIIIISIYSGNIIYIIMIIIIINIIMIMAIIAILLFSYAPPSIFCLPQTKANTKYKIYVKHDRIYTINIIIIIIIMLKKRCTQ